MIFIQSSTMLVFTNQCIILALQPFTIAPTAMLRRCKELKTINSKVHQFIGSESHATTISRKIVYKNVKNDVLQRCKELCCNNS